jgi:hypothetical protein
VISVLVGHAPINHSAKLAAFTAAAAWGGVIVSRCAFGGFTRRIPGAPPPAARARYGAGQPRSMTMYRAAPWRSTLRRIWFL